MLPRQISMMVQMMGYRSARLLRCALLLLLSTACAGGGKDDPLAAAVAALPRFPACEAEIKAFVALSGLARQSGDNWRIYEPALEALKDQVMDCVEDGYPNPIGI